MRALLLILMFLFSFVTDAGADNDLSWLLSPNNQQKHELEAVSESSRDIGVQKKLTLDYYFDHYSDENSEFLKNVKYITDISEVRFIGIHRFWVRRLNRYYRGYINDDRDQFIDSSFKPALAAQEYDNKFLDYQSMKTADNWRRNLPWNSHETTGRVIVYGTRRTIVSLGPLNLTGDLRVRLDLDEIPVLRDYLSLDFGNDEDSNVREEISYSPINNAIRAYQISQPRNTFKFKMRLNVKVDQSAIGVRSVGMRMSGVFRFKKFSESISVDLSLKHQFDDAVSDLGINIVI